MGQFEIDAPENVGGDEDYNQVRFVPGFGLITKDGSVGEGGFQPGGVSPLLYVTMDTKVPADYSSNPDFLLAEGELPSLFPSLEILAAWEGTRPGPRREAVASIVARRPA